MRMIYNNSVQCECVECSRREKSSVLMREKKCLWRVVLRSAKLCLEQSKASCNYGSANDRLDAYYEPGCRVAVGSSSASGRGGGLAVRARGRAGRVVECASVGPYASGQLGAVEGKVSREISRVTRC